MSGARHRQKGDCIEREVVERHEALGVHAERYPLSGASRFRDSGHDVDIYQFGRESAPLVAEVKARKDGQGFAQLEKWLGKYDLLFLRRNHADPLVLMERMGRAAFEDPPRRLRMKHYRTRSDERKVAEDARLLRDWLAWHHEERKAVLAGPHGNMFELLLYILKTLTLTSAQVLLAYVRGIDCSTIDSPTRLIVLHEINSSITNLRTCHCLGPFDDGIEHDSVFRIVRQLLFPALAAPPGA